MHEFLKRFRPEGWFALTYACAFDKSRLAESGGGAIFVTAKSIASHVVDDWLIEQRRIHQEVSSV
jgi:hypothetical protein